MTMLHDRVLRPTPTRKSRWRDGWQGFSEWRYRCYNLTLSTSLMKFLFGLCFTRSRVRWFAKSSR